MRSATAFAPASVGNAAVGFDILGFALDGVGDLVTVATIEEPIVRVERITDKGDVLGNHEIPFGASRNTAAVSLTRLREGLELRHGFALSIQKGIPIGSGMGGSAASAVAAVVAANALLERPLAREEMLQYALLGELVASGTAHPDNIAPCLLGGLTLTVSLDPWNCVSVPIPGEILCVLVHPHIRVDTLDSRKALNREVSLGDYVKQSANLAGFIAGCYSNDLELIKDSFADVIIEPQRALQIPGFNEVKNAALSNGALGAAISGSGPSVFAWVESGARAEAVKEGMVSAFQTQGIAEVDAFISPIPAPGAMVIR
jgi:homoserine kinase